MSERKSSVILELKNRIGGPLRRMRRQVRSATADVRKRFGGLGRQLSRYGVGISAAAGAIAAAAARMTFSVASTGDGLAKLADQLGLGIRELQQYHYAAERMGVDQSVLDQGLGAFSKRLGEARVGTGALTTYLKKANPELLEQLKHTTNLKDAFNLYLKALAAAPNKSDQAAGGAAAFSRGAGLAITRLVRDGFENVRELMGDFDTLHGGITAKAARQSEGFLDAWTRLKTTISGVKFTFAGSQIGALTGVVKSLTEWINKNHDRIATWSKDFAEKLPGRIDHTLKSIREIIQSIRNLVKMIGGWKNAMIGVITLMGAPLILAIAGAIASIGKLGIALTKVTFGPPLKAAGWTKWLNLPGARLAIKGLGAIFRVGIAYEIGKAIGWGLNRFVIDRTALGDAVGRSVAQVRALFGDEEAQAALDASPQSQARDSKMRADKLAAELKRRQAEEHAKQRRGEPSAYDYIPGGRSSRADNAGKTEVGGTLRIQIDSLGRPRVRDVQRNGPMDIDVDSGPLIFGH